MQSLWNLPAAHKPSDTQTSLRSASRGLREFFSHLVFVEQPFHRDMALDRELMGGAAGLAAWVGRPRMIIDESDARNDSLALALELGYHGTSHKNCKGFIKSVLNHALCRVLRERTQRAAFLSAEDLSLMPAVPLHQGFAAVALLNIPHAERNGHHYAFGQLSVFTHHRKSTHLHAGGQSCARVHHGGRMNIGQVRLVLRIKTLDHFIGDIERFLVIHHTRRATHQNQ